METNQVLILLVLLLSKSSLGGSYGKRHETKDEPSFKFHQRGYKLVSHIAEAVYYNNSLISDASAVCYPYNRTTRAINVTATTAKQFSDVTVHAQVYKFMSNEYRYFPITIEFDFCKAVQEDFFDFSSFRNCGNMATNCTNFSKGQTYLICNWIPDSSKFPPYVPPGDYKIELSFKIETVVGATYTWYGSVVEKDIKVDKYWST